MQAIIILYCLGNNDKSLYVFSTDKVFSIRFDPCFVESLDAELTDSLPKDNRMHLETGRKGSRPPFLLREKAPFIPS
jgi:hypothetical protein